MSSYIIVPPINGNRQSTAYVIAFIRERQERVEVATLGDEESANRYVLSLARGTRFWRFALELKKGTSEVAS